MNFDDSTTVWIAAGAALVILVLLACCCCCCCKRSKKKEHGSPASTAPQRFSRHTDATTPPPGPKDAAVVVDVELPPVMVPVLIPRSVLTPSAPMADDHAGGWNSPPSSPTAAYGSPPLSPAAAYPVLAEDPLIVASRVPLDAITLHALVNRGAFGELYRGSYRGRRVAVKKLLPDQRRDLRVITPFLAEIKLAAGLDHPHIVQFIGVAWHALADVCAVFEFMEGGDLRALLTQWDHEGRPHGMDAQKTTLARHVAHALTYLHSLQTTVLYRDLKSRNIVLDESQWLAKLTDFGVSRERSTDHTMTAGVGTLRWMAPEVMRGDMYDHQADIFSLGVVLAELDTHATPYAGARDEHGRSLSEPALLQRIMVGRIRVSFTPSLRPELRRLAESCLALDPAMRPTAAQVLYELKKIERSMP